MGRPEPVADVILRRVVFEWIWYVDTCRRWKHRYQCTLTSEATSNFERPTPEFSTFQHGQQFWSRGRARRCDVEGRSWGHRFFLGGTGYHVLMTIPLILLI